MRFGPAGNCERFYEEGFKRSEQAPAWLAAQGLNAYEYSAGRGVALGEATARAIGAAAAACGVAVSLHAPYYINCATLEDEKREKTLGYLLASARAVNWMGGNRVVFHIGSPTKQPRERAFLRACDLVAESIKQLRAAGLGHIRLCPETMGRPSQIGSLDEVLTLCEMDESIVPTLDFGHLHTVGAGALNGPDDFRRVLDRLISRLGHDRARNFHAHFSKIEYTAKGEKMHRRFSEAGYGPEFSFLAPLLLEYDLNPTIICESNGTQADDALAMKRAVEALAPGKTRAAQAGVNGCIAPNDVLE